MAQQNMKNNMSSVFNELKNLERFNKNKLYLMKLVVDTSSSMETYGTTQFTAVKEFFDDKKNEDNDYENLFSFVTFNSLVKKHQDWTNFKNVNYSTEQLKGILKPNGSTRLIDTAYEELLDMQSMIQNNKDKYEKIIGVFALQTDGHDNQSNQYTSTDLKEKIKDIENMGIVCIFLASNQDAISAGTNYGFQKQNSLGLSATSSTDAYRSLSQAATRYVNSTFDGNFESNFEGFTQEERINSVGPNDSSQFITPPYHNSFQPILSLQRKSSIGPNNIDLNSIESKNNNNFDEEFEGGI